PTHLEAKHPNIKTVRVQNAAEMLHATQQYFPESDITIAAAAVAYFTPVNTSEHKIKKADNALSLQLKPTTDILATLGKIKEPDQILIGFAMETQNEKANAQKKLAKKNLDFIVLNSLNDKNAGFKHDTNKVSILQKNGQVIDFPLKTKKAVADDILNSASDLLLKKDLASH
ncbi:MAG TPA: phosphopantothenoylcysteine decarboxylase, partial [Flavobacteriales bacterium]|nr:phosphopantothenoylcysteine decarboxylase [Flavobacteriales bacterium]